MDPAVDPTFRLRDVAEQAELAVKFSLLAVRRLEAEFTNRTLPGTSELLRVKAHLTDAAILLETSITAGFRAINEQLIEALPTYEKGSP